MKKWMYLIFPGALLVVFLAFYFPDKQRSEKREADQAAVAAQKKADEEKQKEDLENRARADSQRREVENAKALADREAAIAARHAKEKQDVLDDTAQATAVNDKLDKQAGDLQLKLDQLNKDRDSLSREDFDLAKQVQLGEINRSNADLEIQRMVDMIATRASQSSLTQMPPPPPSK